MERVQREQHGQIVGHPHDKYGLSGASAAAANMSAMEADAVASGLLDVRSLQRVNTCFHLLRAGSAMHLKAGCTLLGVLVYAGLCGLGTRIQQLARSFVPPRRGPGFMCVRATGVSAPPGGR